MVWAKAAAEAVIGEGAADEDSKTKFRLITYKALIFILKGENMKIAIPTVENIKLKRKPVL